MGKQQRAEQMASPPPPRVHFHGRGEKTDGWSHRNGMWGKNKACEGKGALRGTGEADELDVRCGEKASSEGARQARKGEACG